MAKRTDWTDSFSGELARQPEPPPAEVVPMGDRDHQAGSHLAEVLDAGGDVDRYLAKYRLRRTASVPKDYRIPLDITETVETWAGGEKHRTSTGLIVALLDAWIRDGGHQR